MNLNQRGDKNQIRSQELEAFFNNNIDLSNRDRRWLKNQMKAFGYFEEGKSPFYNQNHYNKELAKIKQLFFKVLNQQKVEIENKEKFIHIINSIKNSNDIHLCCQKIREYIIE